MKRYTYIVVIFLVLLFIMSGCVSAEDKQDSIDVVEKYMESICDGDFRLATSYTDDGKNAFRNEKYSEYLSALVEKMITETVYDINDINFESSSSAVCEVELVMADLSTIDVLCSLDSLFEQLERADTATYNFEISLIKEKNKWKISNSAELASLYYDVVLEEHSNFSMPLYVASAENFKARCNEIGYDWIDEENENFPESNRVILDDTFEDSGILVRAVEYGVTHLRLKYVIDLYDSRYLINDEDFLNRYDNGYVYRSPYGADGEVVVYYYSGYEVHGSEETMVFLYTVIYAFEDNSIVFSATYNEHDAQIAAVVNSIDVADNTENEPYRPADECFSIVVEKINNRVNEMGFIIPEEVIEYLE